MYIHHLTVLGLQVLSYASLKPTGTHVQYMCILIHNNIDVHEDSVKSPTFIQQIWRPSPEETDPLVGTTIYDKTKAVACRMMCKMLMFFMNNLI